MKSLRQPKIGALPMAAALRPPSKRRKLVSVWETKPPKDGDLADLILTPWFSARGMLRVYGRGDNFPEVYGPGRRGFLICNLDIWQRNDGRIFLRFQSNRKCLDAFSYELTGCKKVSQPDKQTGFDDSWVPWIVRSDYDEWVEECIKYPYD
jgi:hypothetical protein